MWKRAPAAAALSGALLLLGCATRAGFEQRMNAFVGQPEVALVQALGVPARSFELENRRFIQYERHRVMAESYPGWGWRGGVDVQALDCSATFEIVDGKVASFSSRGNDCIATPPS